MKLLDKLERKLSWIAITNLSAVIVCGQVLFFILCSTDQQLLQFSVLIPAKVLEGEVWRLLSFLFVPPTLNLFFAFFAWYLFYLMGSSLDGYWGSFRFTFFLSIAYLATVAVSFLSPYYPASNAYLYTSVFLAFAYLNPNFELMLLFILPVKIKWLAGLTWLSYIYTFAVGDWQSRFLVLAAVSNFLIFFGKDLWLTIRSNRWQMEKKAREFRDRNKPRHRCTICGLDDKADPTHDFRYCSKCYGSPCYCQEHLHSHQHIAAPDNSK